MRTFVIGDIHGALRALEQLVEKMKPRKGDRFIFMGDYVDGWSESAQVIAWLIEFEKKYACVFLRGNHDVWCEEWLGGQDADPTWLFHGGQSTVESYETVSGQQRKAHLDFFNRLRSYYEDEDNRLFVHAGFSSLHGPSRERDRSNFWCDRTLWETALSIDKNMPQSAPFYPRRLKLFREIFIGHTPTVNYDIFRPMHCANVWNVDTGAAFTGPLSAMEVDTKEVLQSDAVQQMYPFERGRNNQPYRSL